MGNCNCTNSCNRKEIENDVMIAEPSAQVAQKIPFDSKIASAEIMDMVSMQKSARNSNSSQTHVVAALDRPDTMNTNNLQRPAQFIYQEINEDPNISNKIESDRREVDVQSVEKQNENLDSIKRTLFTELSDSNERPTTLKTFLTPSEPQENSLNQERLSAKRSQTLSPQRRAQIDNYGDLPHTSSRSTGCSPNKDRGNQSGTHSTPPNVNTQPKSYEQKFEFTEKYSSSPIQTSKEFTCQSHPSIYKTPESNPSENYQHRTPFRYRLDLSAIMPSKNTAYQAGDSSIQPLNNQILIETDYIQTHTSAIKSSPKSQPSLISPTTSLSYSRTQSLNYTAVSQENQDSHIRYINEKTSLTEFESSLSGKTIVSDNSYSQSKKDGRVLQTLEGHLKNESLPFEAITEESLSNLDAEEVKRPEQNTSPQKVMLSARLPDNDELVGEEEVISPVRTTFEISVTKQKTRSNRPDGEKLTRMNYQSAQPKGLEEGKNHQDIEELYIKEEFSPLNAAPTMKRDDTELSNAIILKNFEEFQAQETVSSRVRNSIVEEEQQFGMYGIQCGLATFELTNGHLIGSASTTSRSFANTTKIVLQKDGSNFESPETTERLIY